MCKSPPGLVGVVVNQWHCYFEGRGLESLGVPVLECILKVLKDT